MADSDDPCDDVVGDNLTGWVNRDSGRNSETNSRQRLEGDYRNRRQDSWTRFEHG
tara:strand:- start:48 stop:212 length:165 start_codon:yes stop_codon:yes gene_type:complete